MANRLSPISSAEGGEVAITASILEISNRGKAECRLRLAEVNTVFKGNPSTSRAQIAARISVLRRTCQMAKGRSAVGTNARVIRRASRSDIGVGQPGRGRPTSRMSWVLTCSTTTFAVVVDTPVWFLLKFVTNRSVIEIERLDYGVHDPV